MFTITDDEAAKVRAAFERSGALAAAAEMGRLFPQPERRRCAGGRPDGRPLVSGGGARRWGRRALARLIRRACLSGVQKSPPQPRDGADCCEG